MTRKKIRSHRQASIRVRVGCMNVTLL